MRLAIILNAIVASVAASSASITDMPIPHMPRAEPTKIKSDPWQCVTENITQYIDVPKPTGEFNVALLSYAKVIYEGCTTITPSPTPTPPIECAFPAKSIWCDFTNFAPSTVLAAYSSYGSAASLWLAAKSSGAERVATECPVNWNNMMNNVAGAKGFLRYATVAAACYADAKITSGSSTSKSQSSSSTTTTSQSGASQALVPSPTSTQASNGVLGRMEDIEMLAVVGTLAAAAANTLW